MPIKLFISLAISFFILSPLFVKAQGEKKNSKEKSYGLAEVDYENNSVYLGRKDSIQLSYITPSIGYYDKSGFYVDGSFSYLASTNLHRVDLFTIEGGYAYDGDKLQVSAGAAKFFTNSSSTNVKAEVQGSVYASLGYDLGFITPYIQAGIDLSKKSDYLLSLGIEHAFATANEKLTITPGFLLNAGTQNSYNSYYSLRRFKTRKNGNNGTITADLKDASLFKLRDYEFYLPLSYEVNQFTFSFSPSYAIPVNPAIVTVTITPLIGPTPDPKVFTEKLENTFYFSLSAAYRF